MKVYCVEDSTHDGVFVVGIFSTEAGAYRLSEELDLHVNEWDLDPPLFHLNQGYRRWSVYWEDGKGWHTSYAYEPDVDFFLTEKIPEPTHYKVQHEGMKMPQYNCNCWATSKEEALAIATKVIKLNYGITA